MGIARSGHRCYRHCGAAPLATAGVPLLCAFWRGAAFDGYGVRLLQQIVFLFLRALALVRAVGVRRVGEIFVLVREVVKEECGRMVWKRDRRDKGRVANDLCYLWGW